MTIKHQYRIETPDGTFTRKTARTYTHIVLGQWPDSPVWGAWHWCGSLELAQKQVRWYAGLPKDSDGAKATLKIIPITA